MKQGNSIEDLQEKHQAHYKRVHALETLEEHSQKSRHQGKIGVGNGY